MSRVGGRAALTTAAHPRMQADLHHDDCQRYGQPCDAAHEGSCPDQRKGPRVQPSPGAGSQEHAWGCPAAGATQVCFKKAFQGLGLHCRCCALQMLSSTGSLLRETPDHKGRGCYLPGMSSQLQLRQLDPKPARRRSPWGPMTSGGGKVHERQPHQPPHAGANEQHGHEEAGGDGAARPPRLRP